MQTASGASSTADVLNAVAAILWVALAAAALLLLGGAIRKSGALTKLSFGPGGVSIDFAEEKLQEASRGADSSTRAVVGHVARRSIIDRLQRQADRLRTARILWVDDHPENNTPITTLLREYGAAVDAPRTNATALGLLSAAAYDVIITDVARDNEGPNSAMMGIELARSVFDRYHKKTVLFTARFDPVTLPGLTDTERLALVAETEKTVFGRTNRTDEALHLILDVLERN
jgi:CheY-like chemotaxis protein